jgi:acyl transferase domain-containing protein
MIDFKKAVIKDLSHLIGTLLKIPMEKIHPDEQLINLGLDSILMMDLISHISKYYQMKLTPAKMVSVNTVTDISDILVSDYKNQLAVHYDDKKIETTEPTTENMIETQIPVQPSTFSKSFLNNLCEKYQIELSSEMIHSNSLDEMVEILANQYTDKISSYYHNSFESKLSEIEPRKNHLTAFQTQDIAIVGMSACLPDAPNLNIFWQNLINGKSSIREIPETKWDWKKYYSETLEPGKTISKWGAFVEDIDHFDPLFFQISPKEALLIDPQERLVLQETYNALEDAGIRVETLSGSKTGVFIGYEYSEYQQYLKQIGSSPNAEIPFYSSSIPSYYLANRVSFTFNFTGPSEAFNVNCASSAIALNRAYYSLLNKECDLAIVGGVSVHLFPEDYIANSEALSPDGSCRVFDEHANGYTRGEGCGIVVLKRLEDAERKDDHIYAVIKSCYQNNRGYAKSISDITPEPLTNVIKGCYDRAGIHPETIRYIEVDGYSTKWGDSVEYEAIKKVFSASSSVNDTKKYCGLGSLKANIGHLEPASGIANIIKVALSLTHKKFPATISVETVNEFIDVQDETHPLYLVNHNLNFDDINKDQRYPVRAGINSFADSGVNLHILLEEYPDSNRHQIDQQATGNDAQMVILSAKHEPVLQEQAKNLFTFLQQNKTVSLAHLAYTLQLGRDAMKYRMALIVKNQSELSQGLKEYLNSSKEYGKIEASIPIYTGKVENSESDNNWTSEKESTLKNNPEKLAQVWTQGGEIHWESFYEGKPHQKMSLPTYPFKKKKYWITINETAHAPNQLPNHDVVDKQPDNHNELPATELKITSQDEPSLTTVELEPILKRVRSIVDAMLALDEDDEIDDQTNFAEMGFSSITIVKFIEQLNQTYDLTLRETIAFDYPNIQDLATYLAEQLTNNRNTEPVMVDLKQQPDDETDLESILSDFVQNNINIEEVLDLIER